MKACPACGQHNAEDSRYCETCRVELNPNPAGAPPRKAAFMVDARSGRVASGYLAPAVFLASIVLPIILAPLLQIRGLSGAMFEFIVLIVGFGFAAGLCVGAIRRESRGSRICAWITLVVAVGFMGMALTCI